MTTIYNPYNPNQWELNNIEVPTNEEYEVAIDYLYSKLTFFNNRLTVD